LRFWRSRSFISSGTVIVVVLRRGHPEKGVEGFPIGFTREGAMRKKEAKWKQKEEKTSADQ
jgi:hypothetical protein